MKLVTTRDRDEGGGRVGSDSAVQAVADDRGSRRPGRRQSRLKQTWALPGVAIRPAARPGLWQGRGGVAFASFEATSGRPRSGPAPCSSSSARWFARCRGSPSPREIGDEGGGRVGSDSAVHAVAEDGRAAVLEGAVQLKGTCALPAVAIRTAARPGRWPARSASHSPRSRPRSRRSRSGR